jgi:hypothetical protein
MGYKLNVFSGTLDLTGSGSGSGGDVFGPSSSDDNAIARYDGVTGKLIQNSKTYLQDSGAIEAQGFITNKKITDSVHIGSDQVMITSAFSIELTGELIVDPDGEMAIV